jgi:hypothetical protein
MVARVPRRLVLLALVACRPPSLPAVTDGESPGLTSSGDSTSTTTGCMGSSDCETDAICVAAWTPTTGELGGERGPAGCVEAGACIEALDLGRWCLDHRSCCGDLRCRTADGICEPPDLGVTTGGGDTDTTTETTGETTTTGGTTDDTTTGTTADTTTGTSSTGG